MSFRALSDVNASVGALSKPEQHHPAGTSAAVATGKIQEAPRNGPAKTSSQNHAASNPSLNNGINYNKFPQKYQSIPRHYRDGQSPYQHPALNGCEVEVPGPTALNNENKQDQGYDLAQTDQIMAHGFAQAQTQSFSAPTVPITKPHSKRCTPPEQNNHNQNLAVDQNQPIMLNRTSASIYTSSNNGRALVSDSSPTQAQGENGCPNLASASRTPSSSSTTITVHLSTNTPPSPSSVSSIPNLNVSADTSRDVSRSSSTGIIATTGSTSHAREVEFNPESRSPHVNQTDGDSNNVTNNSDTNADINNGGNLRESFASSHHEKTWMPCGTDKDSEAGCLPQNQTHTTSQLPSGIETSPAQFEKKRKRESALGPERGEPDSFSQERPVSQPNLSSLRTASPLLSSDSAANRVKTAEEMRLAPVIGSGIVLNQHLRADRISDPGTISDSKANASVALGRSEDVKSTTIHSAYASLGSEPLAVITESTQNILVNDHHQSATPLDPRYNPHFIQQVGNTLQNLVATTSIDSQLVLRFSKELYANRKELRQREANGGTSEIAPEQLGINPHSNHVSQAQFNSSTNSALVDKITQKDYEIVCLVQELKNYRARHDAVVQAHDKERAHFHTTLSAKENENRILVERNRDLEVQLSAMQVDKTQIINRCHTLENTLNKFVHNNHPGMLNHPTQMFINSPNTPGTPISPINQQPSFPHGPSHPPRRESVSTMTTASIQGSEQRALQLTRTAPMVVVPRADIVQRVDSREMQPYRQQGYGHVPPGPVPSHANLGHQPQRAELTGQQHHSPTGGIPPSLTPPSSSQFASAQHQQSQQMSTVVQYQRQLLENKPVAQNQQIRRFEQAHQSLPGSPNHIVPSMARNQLVPRHVEQGRPIVHEQPNRRHSEPGLTHGVDIRRGFQGSHMIPNSYTGDQRSPQIYTQLPASQAPASVNAVPTRPLNPPPPGPSRAPLSYMAESFGPPSVQPVHQRVQQRVAPIPHNGDIKIPQPIPLPSQVQASPMKRGPQPTEIGTPVRRSSGDSKADFIDLTVDEDRINADAEGPPKKRLKVDRDKDAGDQSVPATPADPSPPLSIVVDDVKLETENEAMTAQSDQVVEKHVDVSNALPSTLSDPRSELPVESSIIHGIDISNPEVVEHLIDAFPLSEDQTLRYCFYCQFRSEGEPADCPEITRFKDPTIPELLNHLMEEHATVIEAMRSGNNGVEQEEQDQVEQHLAV